MFPDGNSRRRRGMRLLAGTSHRTGRPATTSATLTIAAERDTRYDIIETTDVFAAAGPLAALLADAAGTALIVLDEAVWRSYGARAVAFLDRTSPRHRVLVLQGGEANKTLAAVLEVVQAMDECHTLRRSSPVVVFGGGVVCDIVGFAASIYRRGVPYVRVPTTLLAQVDVSVAIKTGINHGGFRNRLGAFWPARTTIIDPGFLASQSEDDLSHGLGEMIKLGIIKSARLFEALEDLPEDWDAAWMAEDALAAEARRLAVVEMARDLEDNLWEDALARCVDFGHSFSPLIEMGNGLPHGHAVALDCLLSSCLAAGRGLTDMRSLSRIVSVMRRCRVPTSHADFADVDLLWASFTETVTHRDGHQHLPLPSGLGSHVFLEDLTREELGAAVELMRRIAGDDR